MQQHSNTVPSSSETVIVACSERVRAIARGFARAFNGCLDADDLYGAAMLEICEVVAAGRLAIANDQIAYLCGVARRAMIDEWRKLHNGSTLSLDVPVSEDGSYTLLDTLPAPVPSSIPTDTPVALALDKAIRRLPSARQRASIRRRYGLPGYGECELKAAARAMHTTIAAVDSAARRGVRKLASDAALCEAAGVTL